MTASLANVGRTPWRPGADGEGPWVDTWTGVAAAVKQEFHHHLMRTKSPHSAVVAIVAASSAPTTPMRNSDSYNLSVIHTYSEIQITSVAAGLSSVSEKLLSWAEHR